MNNGVKDYFSFSSRERKGIIVLLFLNILVMFGPYAMDLFSKPKEYNFDAFEKDVARLDSLRILDPKSKRTQGEKMEFAHTVKQVLQDFNPNKLPDSIWHVLGLNPKQVQSIYNYENKGGIFRTKSDLKKMYAIHDTLFAQLEPYIQLPEVFVKPYIEKNKIIQSSWKERKTEQVEINSADSTMLESLPGIGAWTALKIIRYRERLGGFISLNQLYELKNMDSARVLKMIPFFTLNLNSVKKIKINEVVLFELQQFPYIDYMEAKMIISYRIQHGKYNKPEEVQKAALLDDDVLQKILPYLQF